MNILRKPIGKHVLFILGGLVLALLLSDVSVLKRAFPSERVLTVSGTIDPSLNLYLGSNYLARRDGIGCSSWSLFGGWQLRHTGERRTARVSDGHYAVSVPVDDRSADRCGYTLQGVSLGISANSNPPTRWIALFDYSDAMSGTELTVDNPLEAYCSPMNAVGDDWFCSRRSDAQKVLGYRTDRMPGAMTLNIHVQSSRPYALEF